MPSGLPVRGVTVTIVGARNEADEVSIVAVYTHSDTSLGKSTSYVPVPKWVELDPAGPNLSVPAPPTIAL